MVQLASPTWDASARQKLAESKGVPKWDGKFAMAHAGFHDSIRVPASESVGFIGKGACGSVT